MSRPAGFPAAMAATGVLPFVRGVDLSGNDFKVRGERRERYPASGRGAGRVGGSAVVPGGAVRPVRSPPGPEIPEVLA